MLAEVKKKQGRAEAEDFTELIMGLSPEARKKIKDGITLAKIIVSDTNKKAG